MNEYAITITVQILADSEDEARAKLAYRITDSYVINSMGQIHTAGTTCSKCGQHHTMTSAARANSGSAPVDVTERLLEAGGA